METPDAALFLLLVAFGAAVQTVTGFAMGLVIMGGVALLGLASIGVSAAVVSIVSFVNVVTALRYSARQVERGHLVLICLGMFPALLLGVYLLGVLTGSSYDLARRLLGLVILLAGGMLLLRPQPWAQPSPKLLVFLSGAAGGVAGGLFSTSGPPIAFLMYRQPLPLTVIRATLLAVFALATFSRTVAIAALGQMTVEILVLSAVAVPVVMATTLVTQRALPLIPDTAVRRTVFVLLIAVGGYLMVW